MRISAALDVLRNIGAARFLVEIPPWLLRPTYNFIAVDPSAVRPLGGARIPFRLDVAGEGDLGDMLAARPGFYTLPQVQARLREGHLGFVGRSQGRVVHVRWVFVGSVYLPYLSRRLVLAPGEGFLDEIFTLPAFRRQGVLTAAAGEMTQLLQARGFRRIIGAMAAWNRVPQRVSEAQGYRRVGVGGYWNLFGYKRFFWRGLLESRDGDLYVGTG